MKVARILWATLICAPLAFEASARAPSQDASARAPSQDASARAPSQDASAGAGHADELASHLISQPRRNADHPHALPIAEARGHPAEASSRLGRPTLPVRKFVARQAPTGVMAVAGRSSIGGPHAAGSGRLGGPAAGRAAHGAAIDGTQVHRKF